MNAHLSPVEAQRAEIVAQLLDILRERRSPFMSWDGVDIDVEDLVEDSSQFFRQASYRLAHRLLWPCVVVNRVDLIDGQPAPRFVPINVDPLEEMGRGGERALITQAQEDGVSVSERSIEQASDGFFSGIAESVLGRAKSIILGSLRNPEVEIVTSPQGDRILYSKGHFFSTSTVFGHSDCRSQVKPQTYCFYKATVVPHYGMHLWTIVSDTRIPL